MKGYMYILLCGDGSYYTGSTTNLELRLNEHQKGDGANHTCKHLPVKLLYFEEFSRIDDAFYREKQVQGWSRSKKEALINGDINKLKELSKNSLRQAQGTTSTSKMVPSTSSGTGDIEMDPTVPSTSSGTGDIEMDPTVPSTSSGTASTSSGTGSTDNSESKRPVAEPVEAIAVTIDSDSAKSVSEPVEATVLPTTPPMAEPVEAIAVTIDSDSAKSVAEPVEAKPFTIGDLINELKRYPEDVVVLTDGYEGDYENILQPKLIRVMLIQNQPYYYGKYHISEDVESFEALVIKREVRPFNL